MVSELHRAPRPRFPLKFIVAVFGVVAAISQLAQPWLPDTVFVERAPLVFCVVCLWTLAAFQRGRHHQWLLDAAVQQEENGSQRELIARRTRPALDSQRPKRRIAGS
jgi:hypothetical protein